MRRLLMLSILALAVSPARAQEYDATIEAPDVEVRSGPSMKYYGTGKLRQGARVRVKKDLGEFLAIVPPPDAFSIVAKQNIQRLPGNEGVVNVESTDTFVGSTLVSELGVRGTKLSHGSVVTILQEIETSTVQGKSASFYKIMPLNESRYIPAEAIRKTGIVRAGGSSPVPGGGVQPAGGMAQPPMEDQIGALLNRADVAYKRGETNGDWAEAKQIYDELARSTDHQARMIAWNRLSHIRRRAPLLFTRNDSGTRWQSNSPAGDSRASPGGQPTTPAKPSVPTNPSGSSARERAQLNPVGGPGYRGGNIGRLRRAPSREQGRPVYLIEDTQGRLLYYLAPATGLDLEPLVEQQVEINGGPIVYRHDLKGNYRVAVSARRVQ